MNICTYSERTDQQHCMYNLIKVKFKFLGNKKDQQKVFILKFEKLTQYFLLSLSFELSKLCLFLKLNV